MSTREERIARDAARRWTWDQNGQKIELGDWVQISAEARNMDFDSNDRTFRRLGDDDENYRGEYGYICHISAAAEPSSREVWVVIKDDPGRVIGTYLGEDLRKSAPPKANGTLPSDPMDMSAVFNPYLLSS